MHLQAAIVGDLRKMMETEVFILGMGIKTGTTRATNLLKEVLRAQVRSAGLSRSVENAWQSKVYPRGDSMKAAGYIYSKAKRIHSAFDIGGTITPKAGQWLVIPLPAARKLRLDLSYDRSRGSRPRHWSDVDAAIRHFGALRRVPLSGGRILLVADYVTAAGGRRKIRVGRNGAVQPLGNTSMPLFLLVKRVRLGKHLDIDAAVNRAGEDFIQQVLRGIDEADRASTQ